MSDLIFIRDVIYSLKIDYGEPVSLCRDTETLDTSSGVKTASVRKVMIPMAIPLPMNLRQMYIHLIAQKKEGYIEPGSQQFLLDKDDIPADFGVKQNDYLWHQNIRKNVRVVEDDQYGYILTTRVA